MMRKRRRYGLLIFGALLFLLLAGISPRAQADVEWNVRSRLNLDKEPLDVASSPRGGLMFVLTDGEVLAYSEAGGALEGRIPVDKGFNKIAVSSNGDLLFLTNEKSKALSMISVELIHPIDVTGAYFQGPAKAPVVIAVFSDFQ